MGVSLTNRRAEGSVLSCRCSETNRVGNGLGSPSGGTWTQQGHGSATGVHGLGQADVARDLGCTDSVIVWMDMLFCL